MIANISPLEIRSKLFNPMREFLINHHFTIDKYLDFISGFKSYRGIAGSRGQKLGFVLETYIKFAIMDFISENELCFHPRNFEGDFVVDEYCFHPYGDLSILVKKNGCYIIELDGLYEYLSEEILTPVVLEVTSRPKYKHLHKKRELVQRLYPNTKIYSLKFAIPRNISYYNSFKYRFREDDREDPHFSEEILLPFKPEFDDLADILG